MWDFILGRDMWTRGSTRSIDWMDHVHQHSFNRLVTCGSTVGDEFSGLCMTIDPLLLSPCVHLEKIVCALAKEDRMAQIASNISFSF